MNCGFGKLLAVAVAGALAAGAYWYLAKQAQAQPPRKETPSPVQPETLIKEIAPQATPRSNQLLMRDKLTHATRALEGLSMEDYGKIAEAGDFMEIISKAASWHVIPTDRYVRLSGNFQEQARDLQRHAKEKNLDAASLDYARITLSCVQCHSYLREHRATMK